MRRVLSLFGVLATALLLAAGPVAAQGECKLTVTPVHQVEDGRFFLINASGFAPEEAVDFQLFFQGEPTFPEPEERTANDKGRINDGLTMFNNEPTGEYTLEAKGAECTAEASFSWMPDTAVESLANNAPPAWPAFLALLAGALAFCYFAASSTFARRP